MFNSFVFKRLSGKSDHPIRILLVFRSAAI